MHIIKGIVQMPLKHWQAWGIDHLSRKPVPMFAHPLGKEMLPNVQSEHPLTQLWAIPTCSITGSQGEELSVTFLLRNPCWNRAHCRVFPPGWLQRGCRPLPWLSSASWIPGTHCFCGLEASSHAPKLLCNVNDSMANRDDQQIHLRSTVLI